MKSIMPPFLFFLSLGLVAPVLSAPAPLFDGKTFQGWEGDTAKTWRIEDGVIAGGSMEGNPRNEFLATTKSYQNFHLRLEYRLAGTEGFVNGGVQFRSERVAQPAHEMSGFQADIGAGWSGCLYDESRRNKFLAEADKDFVKRIEKPGEWNSYEIIADGDRILLFINGQRTAIYVESDPRIAKAGKIALQIHGNCKARIFFRNITIEELAESSVPSGEVIMSRFGQARPGMPREPFPGGKLELGEKEIIVFAGQENFVREQKAGHLEAFLGEAWAERRPVFRPMAWEADTVYRQWLLNPDDTEGDVAAPWLSRVSFFSHFSLDKACSYQFRFIRQTGNLSTFKFPPMLGVQKTSLDNPLPVQSRNDARNYNPQHAVEGAPPVAGARPWKLDF